MPAAPLPGAAGIFRSNQPKEEAMSNIITIPRSRDDMVSRLTGIQRLLTATQWEKAAILAAFVQVDQPPGPKGDGRESSHLTPKGFAALRITGLKDHATVRRYVRRWLTTGRPTPQPGEKVDLDGLPDWDDVVDTEPLSGGRPRDSKAEDAAAIIERRGAQQVVENLDSEQVRQLGEAVRQRQQADHVAREDERLHDELENGVDRSELNALEDFHEALRLTEARVTSAYYSLGLAMGDWPQYGGRVTGQRKETCLHFLDKIVERAGVIKMYLSDDVIADMEAAIQAARDEQ